MLLVQKSDKLLTSHGLWWFATIPEPDVTAVGGMVLAWDHPPLRGG